MVFGRRNVTKNDTNDQWNHHNNNNNNGDYYDDTENDTAGRGFRPTLDDDNNNNDNNNYINGVVIYSDSDDREYDSTSAGYSPVPSCALPTTTSSTTTTQLLDSPPTIVVRSSSSNSGTNNNTNSNMRGLHHRHVNRIVTRSSSHGTEWNHGDNTNNSTNNNIPYNSEEKMKKKRRGGSGGGGFNFARAATNLTGANNTNSNNNNRRGNTSNNNGNCNGRMIPYGRYLQSCAIAGIPAYFMGLFLFLYTTRYNGHNYVTFMGGGDKSYMSPLFFHGNSGGDPNRVFREQTNHHHVPVMPRIFYTHVNHLHTIAAEQRSLRHLGVEEKEYHTFVNVKNHLQETMDQRRSRTKPRTTQHVEQQQQQPIIFLEPYSILSSLDANPNLFDMNTSGGDTASSSSKVSKQNGPASLEEICGFHAQKAALQSPNTYRYRDSLIKTSSRKVRVLITGIVSTSVGYRLAHVLKQQCGVHVMIGFDSLYPNTVLNRLFYQEQMAVLTKFIPKLVRPFFYGHIGLDPIKHSKNLQKLFLTNEIDIVQTFQPTHIVHLASQNSNHVYRNNAGSKNRNENSPYVQLETPKNEVPNGRRRTNVDYNPPLYALQNGMISMEQILSSIAHTPVEDRPHFIYASTSTPLKAAESEDLGTINSDYFDDVHHNARRIDEVMADYYHRNHGVFSLGIRMPHLFGPWDHSSSSLYQIFHQLTKPKHNISNSDDSTTNALHSDPSQQGIDLMHVDDVVDAIVSAMQYRPHRANGSSSLYQRPVVLELSSGQSRTQQDIEQATRILLDMVKTLDARKVSNNQIEVNPVTLVNVNLPVPRLQVLASDSFRRRMNILDQTIGFSSQILFEIGLAKTIAWHINRHDPYGPPPQNSLAATSAKTRDSILAGDSFLKHLSVPSCDIDDPSCHDSLPILPCASECTEHKSETCLQSIFDPLVPIVQSLSEECDIVLYTQHFDVNADDLELSSEYVEKGNPLVCNFAFINQDSNLTRAVIEKVPNSELKNFGFEISKTNSNHPASIRQQKLDALNGRLLYRGWMLIWTKDTPEILPPHEEFLLKLSPGRFFHKDVKTAVFIDQQFHVSPKADDVAFLAHEMNRGPIPAHVIKRKNRPKAKFLLPPEPGRRAVILLPELKFQDSYDAERLPPGEEISMYEATRFMRFEIGEKTPLGKEPSNIKVQREFYERVRTYINPENARPPDEASHKFEIRKWVRTRWVAHDLTNDEARTQIRCPWYQEHTLWGTPLDQLSFAYIVERAELNRKINNNEMDDTVKKLIEEKMSIKKTLSDTFEWIPLQTENNKLYSPYEEMQVLPYDMYYASEDKKKSIQSLEHDQTGHTRLLFARFISDRIMAIARKNWNDEKKHKGKHK